MPSCPVVLQRGILALRRRPIGDFTSSSSFLEKVKLVNAGAIQMGLFDERNLFEVQHPDFAGEGLVAFATMIWSRNGH
jgi:hypothetical protein